MFRQNLNADGYGYVNFWITATELNREMINWNNVKSGSKQIPAHQPVNSLRRWFAPSPPLSSPLLSSSTENSHPTRIVNKTGGAHGLKPAALGA